MIRRYRQRNANLRTQLERIARTAGLTPWPKLFQNRRASRATELAATYPAHVAAEWMGHSTAVADRHYWRVTDADFDRAVCAANALQQPVELGDIEKQRESPPIKNSEKDAKSRNPALVKAPPVGLEARRFCREMPLQFLSGAVPGALTLCDDETAELQPLIDGWPGFSPAKRAAILAVADAPID